MLQDANLAKQNKWLLRNTINLLDGINKVAFPVAMVTDALQFGIAIKTDIQQGTGGDYNIVTGAKVAGNGLGLQLKQAMHLVQDLVLYYQGQE